MKNKAALPFKFCLFVVGLLLVVFPIFPAHSASAGCKELPAVPWWKGTTHDTIRNYVKTKNKGNWVAYIKKWEGQLKFLKEVYSKGGSAVVANYKLKGASLKQYIQKVTVRVSISKCLAEESFKGTSSSGK